VGAIFFEGVTVWSYVSQLPLLVTHPAKQTWFWETAVLLAGILLALNLLVIVVVYSHRLRTVLRARRAKEFRARFEPIVEQIAGGELANPEDVRRQIAGLDEFERPIAATMLLERLRPVSPEEREAMLGLLRELGAVDLMVRGTKRWLPWRRAGSLRTLGWLGAEEGVDAALERLRDNNRYVRDASVRALGRIGDARVLPELEKLYLDPDRNVASGFAYEAVAALGPSAAPVFRQGLRSVDEHIRVSSCFGIVSTLDPEHSRPVLEQMLGDTSPAVRAAATETLGRIGGERVPAGLAQAARDYQQSVRRAAAAALGSYDDSHALELLLGALDDPDRITAVRAGESLVRLSRLPGVGAEARAAIERTDAWPVRSARTLAAVGAL
jgi:HEAT repeat protein